MTGFPEFMAADRRLVILRFLKDIGGTANQSVVLTAVERFGHRRGVTRDTIREDFKFLSDHGCIAIEWVSDVAVAAITRRGVHVASGDEEVEGVKKPSIGD